MVFIVFYNSNVLCKIYTSYRYLVFGTLHLEFDALHSLKQFLQAFLFALRYGQVAVIGHYSIAAVFFYV